MISKTIKVDVAYAKPKQQCVLTIEIPVESTIETAITSSGLLTRFPEIDLTKHKVGIFGKQCTLIQWVKEGDRIEIYRPLSLDPKEARRAKVKKNS